MMLRAYKRVKPRTNYEPGMSPKACGTWTDWNRDAVYHHVDTLVDLHGTIVIYKWYSRKRQWWVYDCESIHSWESTQMALYKRRQDGLE